MKTQLIFSFFIFSLMHLHGATKVTWTAQTGSWNEPSNWDCNCIPDEYNVVQINSGEVTIPTGQPCSAFSVSIDTGAALIIFDTLHINNDSISGIFNEGSISNFGAIMIYDAKVNGLSNRGTLLNCGYIFIDSIGNDINLGYTSLSNYSEAPDTAFMDNFGTIEIYSPPNHNLIWTIQYNRFINHPTGILKLIGGEDAGTAIYVGQTGPFSVINYGQISIVGGEISGGGKLINHGHITQHHLTENPQAGCFTSIFWNKPSGVYSMKNIQSGAFVFNDTMINEGLLTIDSTGSDAMILESGGYWENSGQLRISRAGRFGINIPNGASMNNLSDGEIIITKCDENGFDQFGSSSSFYNNGHIRIDSIGEAVGSSFGENGIALRSGGTFLNDSSGIIDITNVRGRGLVRSSNDLCENYGEIHISTADKDCFSVAGTTPFFNRPSGNIYLKNAGESGLLVTKPGFFGVGYFTNQGYIEADSLMGQYGIENSQNMVNDTCGVIVSHSKLRNTRHFNNYGIIKSKSKDAHFFSGLNGINEGVIEDYHGLFEGTNFVNNRIIVSPKDNAGCSSGSITEFLDIGSLNDFTILNIYRNNSDWNVAGAYDSLNNVLNLASEVAGYTPFFVELKNIITNCIDTVQIQIKSGCPVSCPDEPAFWTGCGGLSDHWSDPSNWSTGSVPVANDPVLINGAPASGQFPFLDSTFAVGSLLMLPGANLTLMAGDSLIVGQ